MHISEIDNTLLCSFSERLDGLVCSAVEQELSQRIAEFKDTHKDPCLVFDLAEVPFVSSPFLRICLMNRKAFGEDHFTVTNVSAEIYKVFYISGFTEFMKIISRVPEQNTSETKRKETAV